MKKTVKFSGTAEDAVVYLSLVFSLEKDLDLSCLVDMLEESDAFTGKWVGTDFKRTEIRFLNAEDFREGNKKLIATCQYEILPVARDRGIIKFGDKIQDIKRDADHIAEHVEMLIKAFRGE